MNRGRAIPSDVARALADLFGVADVERDVSPLSGGCIHPAARIGVRPDLAIFAKWSDRPGRSGFGVEARGLRALREARALRVPEVLGFDEGSAETRGWLALELIGSGTPTSRTATELGSGLARLHRPIPGAEPGWSEDGYIGPLAQTNVSPESRANDRGWCAFWREARLRPRWRSVEVRFSRTARDAWERVIDALPTLLQGAAPDGLSLLHGDLWSGNVLTDERGTPVLIDPAVYMGHGEVDLAMMELFGGFSSDVFDSYGGVRPLEPEYEEVRRDLYQLYPLLVHVELFGSGYVRGVESRLERILRVV